MTGAVKQFIDAITYLFRWWFIVLPWEQSVRVRFGKQLRVFEAGTHWRIPFFDKVYIQNTRRRMTIVQEQSLSTLDGKSVTLACALGYRLVNILQLYQSIHNGEQTIELIVNRLVTEFVISRRIAECTAEALTKAVVEKLDLRPFGLADPEFFLTDFVVVRTYRLIDGRVYRYTGKGADNLNTTHTFDEPPQ